MRNGVIDVKVLECSSRGDRRFSAFYAMVEVNGAIASIEQHYQLCKRFNGKQLDLRSAKGKKPTSIVICNKELSVEYLSQWYKLLWIKYFVKNQFLLEHAKQFDKFNDMFKGKSLNCQADVIAEIVYKGLGSVLEDCRELIEILKQPS